MERHTCPSPLSNCLLFHRPFSISTFFISLLCHLHTARADDSFTLFVSREASRADLKTLNGAVFDLYTCTSGATTAVHTTNGRREVYSHTCATLQSCKISSEVVLQSFAVSLSTSCLSGCHRACEPNSFYHRRGDFRSATFAPTTCIFETSHDISNSLAFLPSSR